LGNSLEIRDTVENQTTERGGHQVPAY